MAESDSEFDIYSDTTDTEESEDLEDNEYTYGGHAQTLLSSLDQTIDKIDGYLAYERGFSYGDIVRCSTDLSGQMGQVVNIEMMVDLENFCGEIIKNINSRQLVRIRSLTEGDYVVRGSWLGKVVKFYDLVTVVLDDGTKYTISTEDAKNLLLISSGFLEDGPHMYIPGQRVKVNCSSGFNSWLCGIWNGGHGNGTVCSVDSGPVLVNWITSIDVGSSTSPPVLQDSKDLLPLSCFSHVNWQCGDWCQLPSIFVQHSDVAPKGQASSTVTLRNPCPVNSMKIEANESEKLFSIIRTKMYLDILWQDGTLSVGMDSQNLAPISTIGDHDFWPGQFVLEKSPSDNPQISNARLLGIVKSMDTKENTVIVNWFAHELDHPCDLQGKFIEESHSAYELMEHSDFSYCLGDIVFRLQNESVSSQTDADYDCYATGSEPCIGNIVGRKDGFLEVKWAGGIMSKVRPDEVFSIDKFSIPSASQVLPHEQPEGIADKKVPALDNVDMQRNKKDMPESEINTGDTNNCWDSDSCLYSRKAIDFLKHMASTFFYLNNSRFQSGSVVSDGSNDLNASWATGPKSPSLETTYVFDQCNKIVEGDVPNNENATYSEADDFGKLKKAKLTTDLAVAAEKSEFKQFDIVNDCSDHYFASGNGGNIHVKKAWRKKVLEEWSMLEKDLPESISIRVYEERMDLMRASIVGAAGTPYHDALFFFDIYFPQDYPLEPPAVHYISGGLRLNPNLYESGKVCLSLLNTWAGTGTEVWDPEHSTVLQILLSLQALVLNAKPYFNEAGYDKQIGRTEGERNSTTYNENAFLLSRKSMLYQLRKPPQHFEGLVEQHFASHARNILSTCKAYIDATGNSDNASEGEARASTGFKIMLAKLFPMLIAVFKEKGIDCGEFEVQVATN